jgi:hypothetical protein
MVKNELEWLKFSQIHITFYVDKKIFSALEKRFIKIKNALKYYRTHWKASGEVRRKYPNSKGLPLTASLEFHQNPGHSEFRTL